MIKNAILILGMHRSGTSAITRVINLLGAELPKTLLGANDGNPRGHWESQAMIDSHDRMLKGLGSDWRDWRVLQPSIGTRKRKTLIDAMSDMIESEYKSSETIVIKEPRICRFTSLYLEALKNLGVKVHVILPSRNPIEVMQSLQKRDGMNMQDGFFLWLTHMLEAEHDSRDQSRSFIDYAQFLKDPIGETEQLIKAIPFKLPYSLDIVGEQIVSFVNPNLKREVARLEDVAQHSFAKGWIADSYQAFLMLTRARDSEPALAILDKTRAEYYPAIDHIQNVQSDYTNQLTQKDKELASCGDQMVSMSNEHSIRWIEVENNNKARWIAAEEDYKAKLEVVKNSHKSEMSKAKQDSEAKLAALRKDHLVQWKTAEKMHKEKWKEIEKTNKAQWMLAEKENNASQIKIKQTNDAKIVQIEKSGKMKLAEAEKAYKTELTLIKKDNDAKLVAIKKSHKQSLAQAEQAHKVQLAKATKENKAALALREKAHNAKLDNAKKDAASEIKALKIKGEEACARVKANAQDEIQSLHAEYSEIVDALKIDHAKAISTLQSEREFMQDEMDAVLQKLETDKAQKETNLIEAYHHLHASREELQANKAQLDSILSSTSWRMTRGMRAVINRLRGHSVTKNLEEPEIPPRITDDR